MHDIRPTLDLQTGRGSRRRATAVAFACLALTAPASVLSPAPAVGADDASRPGKGAVTDFGFRSDVYGAKLVTGGVEAFDVKDAHAQLRCTRSVGQRASRSSAVAVPDNPLINVSLASSETHTYREGDTYGVRGTSTIGDVVIGGELPGGVRTPRLVIEGLTSTADAFHRDGRFGHREGFDFTGIRLELLDNTVVADLPPELQELLGPLQEVTDTVFAGTGAVADEVFQVLQDVTRPVEIPGLGTIAVGRIGGKVTPHSASSDATSLHVEVTAAGERQLLELGQARTRIGRSTPAGVFRAGGTAMDLYALDSALHFGSISHKSLPCEGTRGRTTSYHVDSASLLAGTVVELEDVTYRHSGSQKRRTDVAKGFSSTHIGTVSVPAAQLEITDVASRVRMRGKDGQKVARWVATSVGSITAGGQALPVPAPGSSVDLPNGAGVIEHRIVEQSFVGADVTALRVVLFGEQVRIDLGKASGKIWSR